MYAFISLSVFTGTCMSLSPGFYPAACLYALVHVSISLPVCIHLYGYVCIFYQSASSYFVYVRRKCSCETAQAHLTFLCSKIQQV